MEDSPARAHPRSRAVAVAVALLTLLLIGGCSPVSPSESARARAAMVGPAGQMTFQLADRATAFDPFAAPDSADFLLAAAHFEPLVTSVEGRIVPRMAVWWGTADSGRELRVQLKHDRWSDEERMTAADLVFTIEQHLKPGRQSPLLPVLLQISGAEDFYQGRAQFVDGILAETARTVAITLDEPDPNYLTRLTGLLVLPAHIYAERDLSDPEIFRRPAVGSGPYLASEWAENGSVVLTPNPRVKPFTRLDRVVGIPAQPTEVIEALDLRAVDVAMAIPGRSLNEVPEGFQELVVPGDRITGLSGRGPLADLRMRQAVAYAVDREGLLDRYLGGHGRVSESVLFQPDWATSPQRPTRSFDPERARALLAEAGWNPESEIRIVALTPDTDRAVWDEMVRQLAGVGVRASIDVRPVNDRLAVWADPEIDGVIDTFAMPVPDPIMVESWVSCASPSEYCNPRLDALLAEGRAETDPTARQSTYRDVDLLLAEELPVIPLWVPDAAVAVVDGRGGVSPLVQPVTAMIDFWGPA